MEIFVKWFALYSRIMGILLLLSYAFWLEATIFISASYFGGFLQVIRVLLFGLLCFV